MFILPTQVKWLAVKTASEMTYTVSSGELNSAPTPTPTPIQDWLHGFPGLITNTSEHVRFFTF